MSTINGDLFNLWAGPVSFAIGGEYRGERMTRDRDPLNQTFQFDWLGGWARFPSEPGRLVNLRGSAGSLHQPYMELPRILQLGG